MPVFSVKIGSRDGLSCGNAEVVNADIVTVKDGFVQFTKNGELVAMWPQNIVYEVKAVAT